MAELTLTIDVDVPAQALWDAVIDWPGQGRWILLTHVRVTSGTGEAVGDEVAAVTGIGPLAFTDTMRITRFEPPEVCDVEHTGRVVRGTGVFRVDPLSVDRSRFTWTEDVIVPFGALGRLVWPVAKQGVALGVRLSLRRLAGVARERAGG